MKHCLICAKPILGPNAWRRVVCGPECRKVLWRKRYRGPLAKEVRK